MKILLNTDTHIESNEALAAQINTVIEQALVHFEKHITRIEVHLSDENGDKKGQQYLSDCADAL